MGFLFRCCVLIGGLFLIMYCFGQALENKEEAPCAPSTLGRKLNIIIQQLDDIKITLEQIEENQKTTKHAVDKFIHDKDLDKVLEQDGIIWLEQLTVYTRVQLRADLHLDALYVTEIESALKQVGLKLREDK